MCLSLNYGHVLVSCLPSCPRGKLLLQCLDSSDWVNLLIANYALDLLENAAQEKIKKRKVPAHWEEPSGRPGKFPNKSRPCTSISSITQTAFSLWKKAKVSNFDSFHIENCCFILCGFWGQSCHGFYVYDEIVHTNGCMHTHTHMHKLINSY